MMRVRQAESGILPFERSTPLVINCCAILEHVSLFPNNVRTAAAHGLGAGVGPS